MAIVLCNCIDGKGTALHKRICTFVRFFLLTISTLLTFENFWIISEFIFYGRISFAVEPTIKRDLYMISYISITYSLIVM